MPKSLQEHLANQAMQQAANRSALTASSDDPAFAELLAMKTIRPEELKRFEKANVVDEGDLRYIKEAVYNVKQKQPKEIEDAVIQRIANLERIHDGYALEDYKYVMGSAGELICMFIFKKSI
jgi:hypothetical protein